MNNQDALINTGDIGKTQQLINMADSKHFFRRVYFKTLGEITNYAHAPTFKIQLPNALYSSLQPGHFYEICIKNDNATIMYHNPTEIYIPAMACVDSLGTRKTEDLFFEISCTLRDPTTPRLTLPQFFVYAERGYIKFSCC